MVTLPDAAPLCIKLVPAKGPRKLETDIKPCVPASHNYKNKNTGTGTQQILVA
jgi:hypothetical protein